MSTVSSKSPLHVKVIFYELKYFMNFICKKFVFNILMTNKCDSLKVHYKILTYDSTAKKVLLYIRHVHGGTA